MDCRSSPRAKLIENLSRWLFYHARESGWCIQSRSWWHSRCFVTLAKQEENWREARGKSVGDRGAATQKTCRSHFPWNNNYLFIMGWTQTKSQITIFWEIWFVHWRPWSQRFCTWVAEEEHRPVWAGEVHYKTEILNQKFNWCWTTQRKWLPRARPQPLLLLLLLPERRSFYRTCTFKEISF